MKLSTDIHPQWPSQETCLYHKRLKFHMWKMRRWLCDMAFSGRLERETTSHHWIWCSSSNVSHIFLPDVKWGEMKQSGANLPVLQSPPHQALIWIQEHATPNDQPNRERSISMLPSTCQTFIHLLWVPTKKNNKKIKHELCLKQSAQGNSLS